MFAFGISSLYLNIFIARKYLLNLFKNKSYDPIKLLRSIIRHFSLNNNLHDIIVKYVQIIHDTY
jgi:hypothetical protein